MKSIIYIDGFNLFYGCLKHSKDKWLDLQKLFFDQILLAQSPSSELIKIKFFTANILAKVASHGQDAQIAQQSYHRALLELYPDTIQIIKGYYNLEKAKLLTYQVPPCKNHRVSVWKLEEKQTDVNIALEAYRDVAKNKVEQLVFVTNDSDLAPALLAIREDFNKNIKMGLIIPARKPTGKKTHRPANQQLGKYADWTRKHITDNELTNVHLPEKIPTRKKPIVKPHYW